MCLLGRQAEVTGVAIAVFIDTTAAAATANAAATAAATATATAATATAVNGTRRGWRRSSVFTDQHEERRIRGLGGTFHASVHAFVHAHC